MYSLNNKKFELKLEPIFNLNQDCVFGFEALSWSIDGDVNNQVFFDELDSEQLLTLLINQLTLFQKLNTQNSNVYNTIFINITPELLQVESLWSEFIPFAYQFSIHIEVDAKKLNKLRGGTAFYNLARLCELGISFWIDDLDDEIILSDFERLRSIFFERLAGVKFDKLFFWTCMKNESEKYRLTRLISLFKNKCELLVEGIESKSIMLSAIEYGFNFGQGYYWRDVRLKQGKLLN